MAQPNAFTDNRMNVSEISHGTSAPSREQIQVRELHKAYGGEHERVVLGSVSFSVAVGEYVSVVGPSGSGKTTILRCIAGLTQPTSGEVLINGQLVTGSPDKLAVVFQDYSRSLLPWLTNFRNVTLPLQGKGIPPEEQRERALEALDAVGLSHAIDQHPWQLSGGMQQRVAIARALAYRPEALLMDEPFASVDAQTRSDLEDLVLELRQKFNMTVVAITHDIDEAIYMSDRVIVLGGNPAGIESIVDVPLGSQRDQITTKSKPLFSELRAQVLGLVRH